MIPSRHMDPCILEECQGFSLNKRLQNPSYCNNAGTDRPSDASIQIRHSASSIQCEISYLTKVRPSKAMANQSRHGDMAIDIICDDRDILRKYYSTEA